MSKVLYLQDYIDKANALFLEELEQEIYEQMEDELNKDEEETE